MENYLFIHLPEEGIGGIRIFRASVPRMAAFLLMAMQILDENDKFNDFDELIALLKEKGYSVSVEQGIIHDSENDWILVPKTKVIDL